MPEKMIPTIQDDVKELKSFHSLAVDDCGGSEGRGNVPLSE